jgi:hypothetical protein
MVENLRDTVDTEMGGIEDTVNTAVVVATKEVLTLKRKGDTNVEETAVDESVETQPDAKRKRAVLKIPKSKKTPVATTNPMDHILKILEDHLGTDNSWEASAIFAGHKEPVRGDMAKSPILLMRFLSGPKHGQKFERYVF